MIIIEARRWFAKLYGNTYHSVQVFDDNKLIGEVPFEYGYGDSFLLTAHKILQDAGYYKITGKRLSSGMDADYYNFMMDMRRHRNKFHVSVSDVSSRKELFSSGVKKNPGKITTKSEARQEAIDWQLWASKRSLSYGELIKYQNYFRKLAKRFGLMREFRENGIL